MGDYFRFFYASDYQCRWRAYIGSVVGCGLIIEDCECLLTCRRTKWRDRLDAQKF